MEPAPGTPLYVHLPFCAAKCTYCDFYSVPAAGQDLDGVLADLVAEARLRAPRHPRTVFFGGGTPSLYPAVALRRLLDTLDDITGWRTSAVEVTAECNPESLDAPKAEALLAAGVTRLSIGFQSLDPAVLALFGRVHSVEQSFAAFRAAREAGVTRLNVDLIYAAPGQTTAKWRDELDRVLELGPDHLSAYNLTLEPGTVLEHRRAHGALQPLDDEEELAQFFAARERCTAAGLAPYEISNYARAGEECAHNLTYWENGEYVGIGPSAVSKVGESRFGNARSLAEWRGPLARGEAPTVWHERLDDLARLGETWWLGLRLARGLTGAEARTRSGWTRTPDHGTNHGTNHDTPHSTAHVPPRGAHAQYTPDIHVAEEFVELGLLTREPARAARSGTDPDAQTRLQTRLQSGTPPTHARYRLSERGLPVADAIGRRFVQLGASSPSSAPDRASPLRA